MVISCKSESIESAKYGDRTIKIDTVATCPMCKISIKPIQLHSVFKIKGSTIYVENFHFCPSCDHSFISRYEGSVDSVGKQLDPLSLKSCEPKQFKKQTFNQNLNELSPQFVKIHNQALAAEVSDLDEIAGLGYRKALEFLVKDFAIHEHSDSEGKIKSMPLAACIKEYIDAPNIKTLATRSAWIGNDEAHYIRKQEDRDVTDMKSFIQATVYFISMILITEDAATMEPK